MLSYFAVFLLAAPVLSQVPGFGGCPKVNVVQQFDVPRYMGRWYENRRYFAIFQSGKCTTADYTARDDGTVGVFNQEIVAGKINSVNGTAKLDSNSGEAKLLVTFPQSGNIPAPYWVLATDYDRYSLVYSCTDLGVVNFKFSWWLTRDKIPSEEVLSILRNETLANHLNLNTYIITAQDCGDK